MAMTTIKVSKDLKNELDSIKFDKEPYHVAIQRLLKENKELKEQNDKLYDILMNVNRN